MKLTHKKLEKIVQQVINEVSTGQSSSGASGDLASQVQRAKEDLQRHKEVEPTPKSHNVTQSQRYKGHGFPFAKETSGTLYYHKTFADTKSTPGSAGGWGSGDVWFNPENRGGEGRVVPPSMGNVWGQYDTLRNYIVADTRAGTDVQKRAATKSLQQFDTDSKRTVTPGTIYYEPVKFPRPGQSAYGIARDLPRGKTIGSYDYAPRKTNNHFLTTWGDELKDFKGWESEQKVLPKDPQKRYQAWRTSRGPQERIAYGFNAPSIGYVSSRGGKDKQAKPAVLSKGTWDTSRSRTASEDRPAWTNWNSATAEFETALADAEAALRDQTDRQQDLASMTDIERGKTKTGASMGRPRPVKTVRTRGTKALKSRSRKRGKSRSRGKATGGAAMGGLKGGGFGRTSKAKGVGKKRGSGKKKDESIFRILGRDLIKELKSQKKYNK